MQQYPYICCRSCAPGSNLDLPRTATLVWHRGEAATASDALFTRRVLPLLLINACCGHGCGLINYTPGQCQDIHLPLNTARLLTLWSDFFFFFFFFVKLFLSSWFHLHHALFSPYWFSLPCLPGPLIKRERERENSNSNSKTLFSKDCSLGSFRPV